MTDDTKTLTLLAEIIERLERIERSISAGQPWTEQQLGNTPEGAQLANTPACRHGWWLWLHAACPQCATEQNQK